MPFHLPLIGKVKGLIDRIAARSTAALKTRRLLERFKLLPDKQLLLDADGSLRSLDAMLTDLIKVLKTPGSVPKHIQNPYDMPDRSRSDSVSLEIARRLGRLAPLIVIEDSHSAPGQIKKPSYHLIVNDGMTMANDLQDKLNSGGVYNEIGSLRHAHTINELAMLTAKAIQALFDPKTIMERRQLQALEHWHRCMTHIVNDTAGVDCIAALALETAGTHDRPYVSLGARNIQMLRQSEEWRQAACSVDGGQAVRINHPSTRGIQAKEGDDETLGAVHFSAEYETVGIIALKRPIVMITTQYYTLIEMQMPEIMALEYIGKPLSALVDHPLLNRLNLVITSIDTRPPAQPIQPTRLEQQVFNAVSDHFIFNDGPQPNLEQWFHIQKQLSDPVKPMVMIHHRPAPATIITQEEALSFQLP